MHIATKRTLYLLFITLFFAGSPLILIYASGYRFSPKKITFEKTGSIIIESVPKDAAVYLNGKQVSEKTPAKLRFILPDTYRAEIKKEGYFDWKKNIRVESELVSFYKPVYLIQKSFPILVFEGTIDWLEPIPGEHTFLYTEKHATSTELLWYHEIQKQKGSVRTFPENARVESIELSENKKKLLLSVTTPGTFEFFIFDASTRDLISINEKTGQFFQSVHWDSLNQSMLYGLRSEVLYQIDTSDYSRTAVLSDRIDDFVTHGTSVLYTANEADGSFLRKKILLSENASQQIKIPNKKTFSIALVTDEILALSNEENEIFYLVSPDIFDAENQSAAEESILLFDRAKRIDFSRDQKSLLFYNAFELWNFELEGLKKNLITRIGTPIEKAFLAVNDSHIVYQIENRLSIIEKSFQENENFHLLLSAQSIRDVFITGNRKDTVYVNAKLNDQTGIFLIALQEY